MAITIDDSFSGTEGSPLGPHTVESSHGWVRPQGQTWAPKDPPTDPELTKLRLKRNAAKKEVDAANLAASQAFERFAEVDFAHHSRLLKLGCCPRCVYAITECKCGVFRS